MRADAGIPWALTAHACGVRSWCLPECVSRPLGMPIAVRCSAWPACIKDSPAVCPFVFPRAGSRNASLDVPSTRISKRRTHGKRLTKTRL